jgi:ADP-heptose:LPS heptosyltransferase
MKLLFITANRIGDAVLSTGILASLLESYPTARVTIAVGPAAASLFRAVPAVEHIIVVNKLPLGLHWAGLWRATAGTRWDIVVDLRRSAIAWTLRAGKRCIIPKRAEQMHRVRLLATTIGADDNPPNPKLWADKKDESTAARLIPNGVPVLALAPAANWRGKQWDAANFSQLSERLTAKDGILAGARIAILAAAQERAQTEQVLQSVPRDRLINLVGKADLATISACLKRCQFFVGNDSGLSHMAAAAGVPTLSLFGPSRPELYAPWGNNTTWVRTIETYDELIGVPNYDHRTTGSMMNSLTVEMVEEAAIALWRRTQAAAT